MYKVKSEIRVIYADTDAMGIVYHTNYIKWFEVGRNEYLREVGFPYKRLEEGEIWLPVANVECSYIAPAKYDDILEITAWLSKLNAASLIINYEIHNKKTGSLLVHGNTKHAVTDNSLKIVRLKTESPTLFNILSEKI